MLRAALFHFTPVHHQSRQHGDAADFLGVDKETIRRWAHGHTSPKAETCWPLFFVVMLQNLPVPEQRRLIETITGLTEDWT